MSDSIATRLLEIANRAKRLGQEDASFRIGTAALLLGPKSDDVREALRTCAEHKESVARSARECADLMHEAVAVLGVVTTTPMPACDSYVSGERTDVCAMCHRHINDHAQWAYEGVGKNRRLVPLSRSERTMLLVLANTAGNGRVGNMSLRHVGESYAMAKARFNTLRRLETRHLCASDHNGSYITASGKVRSRAIVSP